jgi:NADPH:quinone reductase-like Zn-dependent oxidoreductase
MVSMERSSHRVVVSEHGGPEVLSFIEEPMPIPGPDQARVRVFAAGVSGYDLMFRRSGRLPGTPKVPFTLGVDVVGVVDETGDAASGLTRGQVVAGWTMGAGGMGGYAEHVCLPVSDLVPVPDGVDPAAAVCVVVNYLTAHAMMHRVAGVQAGERVLVHGGAGGVGSALVQLGGLAGLELYATASGTNSAVIEGLGATPIDYRAEDFVARIRELTGDGVDVVFDPVGGGRQLWHSYRTLRPGGRLVWFGVASTRDQGLRVIPGTLLTRLALSLIPDGKRSPSTPDLTKLGNAWYRETLSALLNHLARGELAPLVASRIPLAEASRAHELLERGGHAGKVVLVTGLTDGEWQR